MEYIINPNTNRSVKIGSKTYKKLVKDGIIPSERSGELPGRIESVVPVTKPQKSKKEIAKDVAQISTEIFKQIENGDLDIPDNFTEDQIESFIEKQLMERLNA